MKELFLITTCFVLPLVFSSCSSGKYTVSANGDKAEVKLMNGREFESEIVFISDTAIIFATIPDNERDLPKLFYSHKKEIKSITVQGYDGSGWGSAVLLYQVLPAGLLAGAAASYSEGSGSVAVGLIFAIPAAITALLFSATDGVAPEWNDEMPLSEIETLKIYSRFPEELSQMELNKLLKSYNQTAIKKYF